MSVASSRIGFVPGVPRQPLTFRWFDRCPWHPAIAGMGMAVLMSLAYAMIESLSGRPQALLHNHTLIDNGCPYLVGDYRIGMVGILILVASMTARYLLAGWARESMTQLRRSDLKDAEALADESPWGILPGLIGIVLCLAVAVDIAERDIEWTRSYWIFPHVFNWAWCIPFGWVGGRLIYSLIANALAISRIAERTEIQDLSSHLELDIAVKHGSRSALISLMFIGILSVHFVDPGLDAPAIVFLVVLFLAGAGFSTVPALGVVRKLYLFRDKQLDTLRSELETEQQQLYAKHYDYEPGRIADIIAMEQRLQSWTVNVFHFSNVARVMTYALVGFFSWIGAAAVSVFIENLFQF